MSALEWQTATFGSGQVGCLRVGEKRIQIATISWSTARGAPEPWVLATSLPGFYRKTWKFATQEEAQVKADVLLASFAAWAQTAIDLDRTAPQVEHQQ